MKVKKVWKSEGKKYLKKKTNLKKNQKVWKNLKFERKYFKNSKNPKMWNKTAKKSVKKVTNPWDFSKKNCCHLKELLD